MESIAPSFRVRPLEQEDVFWLKDFDCSPLPKERDSIYLFFCAHFAKTSFVAEDAATGEVVGFLLGFVPAGEATAYVHYLFVVETRRRDGIATSLVEAFSTAASSLGASQTLLFTRRASSFWESLGFAPTDSVFAPNVAAYLGEKGHTVLGRSLGSAFESGQQ